jgi:sugar lactone lactonase YvrE
MGSDRLTAELMTDARAMIGEGPVWDHRGQRLLWVDIPNGVVHRLDPSTGASERILAGQPVGSVGIRRNGGLVAALRDGFGLLAPGEPGIERLIEVEKGLTANRMNDGKCDCRGRFWAGTMATDHTPKAGALYCLRPEGSGYAVSQELDAITVANGIDWSPDNRLMYYIDSPTQRVDAFDFDPDQGRLRNRRPLIEIAAVEGLPDGMTVDAEGFLWVALFRSGKVRRYSPAGTPDIEIRLPVTLVTSCAFGGADLGDLYITTARHRLTPAEAAAQAIAGGLFVCRPGPIGRPAFHFAG